MRQAIAHAVNRAQIIANTYPDGTELDSQLLPLLPLAHTRTALVTRREILGLSASPLAIEAYKDATFATARVYLPLVRK